MLNDEEKKAIDELKEEINKPLEVPEDKFDTFILYNIESAKTILNLIEKQSKEIEELKEKNEYLPGWVGKKYISKDKIKAILGIEDNSDENILTVLQTIVDENARLEDIEDRKVQIEYNNVFNKGVKSVEDKIKAKIKELDKKYKEAYNKGFKTDMVNRLREIKLMQSLLEKE